MFIVNRLVRVYVSSTRIKAIVLTLCLFALPAFPLACEVRRPPHWVGREVASFATCTSTQFASVNACREATAPRAQFPARVFLKEASKTTGRKQRGVRRIREKRVYIGSYFRASYILNERGGGAFHFFGKTKFCRPNLGSGYDAHENVGGK